MHPLPQVNIVTFLAFINKHCTIDTVDFFTYVEYNLTSLNSIFWTGYIKVRNIEGRIYVPSKYYAEFKYYLIYCKDSVYYKEYITENKPLRLKINNMQDIGCQIKDIKQHLYDHIYDHIEDEVLALKCLDNNYIFIINNDYIIIIFKNIVINYRDIESINEKLKGTSTIIDLEVSSEISAVKYDDKKNDATNAYYVMSLGVPSIGSMLMRSPYYTNFLFAGVKEVKYLVVDKYSPESFVSQLEMYFYQYDKQLLKNINKETYSFDFRSKKLEFKLIKPMVCLGCSRKIKTYVINEYGLSKSCRCPKKYIPVRIDHPFFPLVSINNPTFNVDAWKREKKGSMLESYVQSRPVRNSMIHKIKGHLGIRKQKADRPALDRNKKMDIEKPINEHKKMDIATPSKIVIK